MFLLDVAALKASVFCLYLICRDWSSAFKSSARPYAAEFEKMAEVFIEDINVFIEHRGLLGVALFAMLLTCVPGGKERLFRIYQTMDLVSRLSDEIRREEDWVRSMWSRGYQYQRYCMSDFGAC